MPANNAPYCRLKLHCLLWATTLLFSCTATITESDRDRDSRYRGYWITTVLKAPENYQSGTTSVNCLDLSGSGSLQIAGGRVVARASKFDLAGFVSKDGKFTSEVSLLERSRVAIPDDGRYGEKKLLMDGQLDAKTGTGTGQLTVAYEDFGFRGCNSPVELIKSEIVKQPVN